MCTGWREERKGGWEQGKNANWKGHFKNPKTKRENKIKQYNFSEGVTHKNTKKTKETSRSTQTT